MCAGLFARASFKLYLYSLDGHRMADTTMAGRVMQDRRVVMTTARWVMQDSWAGGAKPMLAAGYNHGGEMVQDTTECN